MESDSQALLTQLAPIAVEAVTSLATDKTLSGEQKRATAVNQITSNAKTAGIQAGASLINLAIEYAVQNIGSVKPVAVSDNSASGILPNIAVIATPSNA